jgi:hypothetical protein
MRRLLRVLTVVAAAAAMVGAATTPASAGDGGVAVFQGTANIPGGIGYPCTNSGGSPDPGQCPTPGVSQTCLVTALTNVPPGPKKCKPVTFTNDETDMLPGTFTSSVCAGIEVNAGLKGKPESSKSRVGVGSCTISASFTVLGYCGLSTGEGNGNLTTTNALTGQTNVTLFDFTWTSTATVLVLFIQWWKGPSWASKPAEPNKGIAVVSAIPDPVQTLPPPLGSSQSCRTHSQRDFAISGVGAFLPTSVL